MASSSAHVSAADILTGSDASSSSLTDAENKILNGIDSNSQLSWPTALITRVAWSLTRSTASCDALAATLSTSECAFLPAPAAPDTDAVRHDTAAARSLPSLFDERMIFIATFAVSGKWPDKTRP